MDSRIITIFVAALSGAGLGTTCTLAWLGDEPAPLSRAEERPGARQGARSGQALDARLREIEARLERVAERPALLAPPAVREAVASDPDREDLEVRVAALELALEEGRRSRDRVGEADAETARETRRRPTDDESRASILDPVATEAEKLAAWQALRFSDGWTDDVVSEMIRIGETSADADVRADVWRQADGRGRNTMLVGPLLRALQSDPDAGARSEAAETLANYVDEPGVRAALESASNNDPDRGVRKEANGSLDGE